MAKEKKEDVAEDVKKELTLDELLKELKRQKFSVKRGSEIVDNGKISTGIFPLDWVLGGGIVQSDGGHRIEFWGGESSGKTRISLHIAKKFQGLGKKVAFIDGEHSWDATWASLLGVDIDNILLSQPDTLEEMGNMLPFLIKNADLIIIDSVTSFIPEVEVDKPLEEQTMGVQAKLLSEITRKVYAAYKDRQTVIIFINQIREKIGGPPQAKKEVSAGGRAIRHLYSTRVEFRAGAPIDTKDKERIGHELNLKCIKNKRGPANRVSQLNMYNDGTIDTKDGIFSAALKHMVIILKGMTYTYKGLSVVGKDNFIEQFTEWDKLEEDVWQAINK